MDYKVTEKLEALFKLYNERLPQKIQNLEDFWLTLNKQWDDLKFKDFHREVHSLCGSSGTYGYDGIEKIARQMEIYLKKLLTLGKISNVQQDVIANYIEQLKVELSKSSPQKPTLFTDNSKIENKLIYILEEDKSLVAELTENLKYAGYTLEDSSSLNELKLKIEERPPIAIILDSMYLECGEIQSVLEVQKQQPEPIQLFCILPNGDLLLRVEAVRAGCTAFFQKPVDVFDLTQTLNQKCSITGECYRILIIDDEESLAEYYSVILRQAGMITYAISNPLQLLEALEAFKPDLLLMDIYMPQCSGLELAAVLRQESRYTKLPIIFFSTEEDRRKQLSALSLGGDDFLTKPITPQHLISAVRSRSRRANVLNYFMTTDSLTGLMNHSSILKRLELELENAKQKNCPLSFIMIDIDNFKKINDSFGHPVGDVVIKKLSTLLSVRLRNQDLVGRYGGEEFAVLLPGASAQISKERCDMLREYFSQYRFNVEENHFYVSFSAGIATYDPLHDDAQSVIEKADKALYLAKQRGRNQVIIYEI